MVFFVLEDRHPVHYDSNDQKPVNDSEGPTRKPRTQDFWQDAKGASKSLLLKARLKKQKTETCTKNILVYIHILQQKSGYLQYIYTHTYLHGLYFLDKIFFLKNHQWVPPQSRWHLLKFFQFLPFLWHLRGNARLGPKGQKTKIQGRHLGGGSQN